MLCSQIFDNPFYDVSTPLISSLWFVFAVSVLLVVCGWCGFCFVVGVGWSSFLCISGTTSYGFGNTSTGSLLQYRLHLQ